MLTISNNYIKISKLPAHLGVRTPKCTRQDNRSLDNITITDIYIHLKSTGTDTNQWKMACISYSLSPRKLDNLHT